MKKIVAWFVELVDDIKFLANKAKTIASSIRESKNPEKNQSVIEDTGRQDAYRFTEDSDLQQQLNIGLIEPVGANHSVNSASPFFDGSTTIH